MKKTVLALLLATFSSVSAADLGLHIDGVKTMLNEAQLMVNELNATKLKNMLDEDDEFFLIDLREKDQQNHGEIYHIDGLKISRGYLEFEIEQRIKDKKSKVIVYCCTGQRSILAAKSLIQMGYKNVYSLKGGLKEWVDTGLPLDTVYGEMIIKK